MRSYYICGACWLSVLLLTGCVQSELPAQKSLVSATRPSASAATRPCAADDLRARESLRKVSDVLRESKCLSVDVAVSISGLAYGIMGTSKTQYDVVVRRPKEFAIAERGDGISPIAVSDGVKAYTYWPPLNRYSVEDSPGSTLPAVASGVGWVVLAILRGNLDYEFLKVAQETRYTDKTVVDGVACHLLEIHRVWPDALETCQVLITAGDMPLLRSITITLQPLTGRDTTGQSSTRPSLSVVTSRALMQFENWNLHAEIPADRFQFVPPKGAEQRRD